MDPQMQFDVICFNTDIVNYLPAQMHDMCTKRRLQNLNGGCGMNGESKPGKFFALSM